MSKPLWMAGRRTLLERRQAQARRDGKFTALSARVSDSTTASVAPNPDLDVPNLDFGVPDLVFGVPNLDFGVPNLDFGVPNLDFDVPNLDFDVPNREFEASKFTFDASYVNFWIDYPDAGTSESPFPATPGRFDVATDA